jgi:hypothetical protein
MFGSAFSYDFEEIVTILRKSWRVSNISIHSYVADLFQASKDVDESSNTDPTNQERGKHQKTKESLQAEVCAKFTALMTIFTSDVKLEEEYLKEFQVSTFINLSNFQSTTPNKYLRSVAGSRRSTTFDSKAGLRRGQMQHWCPNGQG